MKALVTGANGMLGQDLCPLLEDFGYEVIETDIHNLDITKDCTKLIEQENPEIVFHCAAYTNVDKAEDDLNTARLINEYGTENVAKVCAKIDSTMVYISTDYVFDGTKKEPYTPEDKPNPINNYGLTKLLGEEAVKKYCKKYYIVRTSWLYGHHGKNFVESMITLANPNKDTNQHSSKELPVLKVVNDQVGCPTWTVELANGIIKILDKPYGIYHICGSNFTSWYNFAKEIFELENIDVNLQPCSTKDYPRPAKRPKYSVMENNKLTRDWRVALKDYLTLREEN